MKRIILNITPYYIKSMSLIVAIFFIQNIAVVAQDLHFSQFSQAPLLLNPALTGFFDGDMRLVANYRNQMSSIAPYRTLGASADFKVFKDIIGGDMLGMGGGVFSDQAGDLNLNTSHAYLSIAHTKMLNKNPNHYISVGFQGGIAQRSINISNSRTNSQYGTAGFDPNADPGIISDNESIQYLDFATGLFWFSEINEFFNMYGGGALFHFNNPDQKFTENGGFLLPARWTFHGGSQISLSDKINIIPAFSYFYQHPNQEVLTGSYLEYKFQQVNKPATILSLGSFYRWKRSLIWVFRIDYNDLGIGISYDSNLFDLYQSFGIGGGLELSLVYTPNFPGKKNSVFKCPEIYNF